MAQRHEVDGLALEFEHCFLMNRIEYKLVPVLGAHMLGNLERAVENAHSDIGSGQGQLASDGFRRNGVVVEIEANIDGFPRAYGLDSIGCERMQGRSQQWRLLF